MIEKYELKRKQLNTASNLYTNTKFAVNSPIYRTRFQDQELNIKMKLNQSSFGKIKDCLKINSCFKQTAKKEINRDLDTDTEHSVSKPLSIKLNMDLNPTFYLENKFYCC